ncbi:DNA-binding transcriptional regulator, MarR family [Vibrio xiamenensis]|uniref:DNA-binding transcriptional regulator, MarR family n=1 Tax=Vibrio xiamenensis TaxID=861298 RepID=A0A1G8ANL5_9VIBR|nr:MarR family transcriptional regulator [Vibrio xiamenensis]SDH21880.1 DNA-binding transcriptional regulator, MarR family [Vibrio xiamenensis]
MTELEKLNRLLTEFYDKMSSWEQSVVKETGYSLAQIHTIEVLGSHGAMRMKELAEKLGITTGTLTVQIDKLVRAELIERMPSENDRRAIVVGLTAQGLNLHRQHNQLHLELVNELTQELNSEQPAQLIGCLEKMIRAF